MAAISEVSALDRKSISPSESEFDHALPTRGPLYLFACHSLWRREGNLKAYQEVLAALDDRNPEIRALAESLLQRSSPRPQAKAIKGLEHPRQRGR